MALRRAQKQVSQELVKALGQTEQIAIQSAYEAPQGIRTLTLQSVRIRMKAVKNIQKITSAMKMVAVSKMRKAELLARDSRGLSVCFFKLLPELPTYTGDKTLNVPVCTDRGLCGGLNINITRYVRVMDNMVGVDKSEYLAPVGEKGKQLLSREFGNNFLLNIGGYSKQRITFATASAVSEEILKTEYDAAKVYYNRFVNTITTKPTIATILSPDVLESNEKVAEKLDQYELEGPDRVEMLQDLGEFQLASTLYNAMLENNCSEHSSRVQAMENSSKSSKEILKKLELMYNRTRQSKITNELSEIVSGAAALEGGGAD